MANLCVKKYVMFVWGLLECLLFSGVVFGWGWLVQILKYDGYFSEVCHGTNVTDDTPWNSCKLNVTTSSGDPLSKPTLNTGISPNKSNYLGLSPVMGKLVQSNHTPYVKYFGNFTDCVEQDDQFAIMYCSVYFALNSLTLLAGIFYDRYGTMRTRLVAVLMFTLSTLMMTFSSPGVPWLVVPALSLVALGGNMILMTNLQVANLHSSRRSTVMATYIGAHDSSAIIVLFMKLSHIGNINVQTSFMFLTIGIVPLLVSTIAFLPKIRIPWPLPAHYGKKRGVQVDELVLRQQQIAWQRKMSAANSKSKLKGKLPFGSSSLTSLYICSVIWFGINLTKPVFYVRNLRTLLKSFGTDEYTARTYEDNCNIIQMLGICFAPIAGVLMDRRGKPVQGASPYVRQMENVLTATIVTTVVSLAMNIMSSLPFLSIQIATFLLTVVLRVFTIATTAAFLTHVHFPQEHFGKLYGLSTFVAALFGSSLFPLRYLLNYVLCHSFYINIAFFCLTILTIAHPVNMWRHCHNGWIKDMSAVELERRRKSSCAEPLVSKQKLEVAPNKDTVEGNSMLAPSPSRSNCNAIPSDLLASPSKSQDKLSVSNKSLTTSHTEATSTNGSSVNLTEADLTPSRKPSGGEVKNITEEDSYSCDIIATDTEL